MAYDVERAMKEIRQKFIDRGCHVKLLGTTNHGVVRVNLSGEYGSNRLQRFLTMLEIEDALKGEVPAVKIVMEVENSEELFSSRK